MGLLYDGGFNRFETLLPEPLWRMGMYAFCAGVVLVAIYAALLPEPDTKPEYAHGCFTSSDAPPILIGPSGVEFVSQRGILISPYELQLTKRGYAVLVEGAVEFVRTDEGFFWRLSERNAGVFLSFEGPGKWTSPDGQFDPEHLDSFVFHTRDLTAVRFVRSDIETCSIFK